MLKVIARCLAIRMLSRDIYRVMLKRMARYFENHNESYCAIACNLSSDVNEVSSDKILHRSMLIQYRAIKFYIAYFILFYSCFYLSPILKQTAYHYDHTHCFVDHP